MKEEYEARINKILHVYHLSNQHGSPSGGYSITMLRHSLHHLCGVALCSDDADIETIAEIRSFIARVSQGMYHSIMITRVLINFRQRMEIRLCV